MTARGAFRVSVTKDYLVFASAHFITFAGHRCEGLHGHNYRARVTIEGDLNQESWFVFDFVELKRIMKRLCDEIDHLVLLPLKSDRVGVVEEGETVSVSVDGKPRYVFPRRDCALLPIPNTTVEMLAQMLTERLQGELEKLGAKGLTAIEMEVEENFGQSAVYRVGLSAWPAFANRGEARAPRRPHVAHSRSWHTRRTLPASPIGRATGTERRDGL
jgi:6-pyruvoyltetrahydropterin/6-carboxytetrahydropterin synthase